jgi:AmiR/NasT family two-component response regulator
VTRPPLALVAEDAAVVRLDLCRLLVEQGGFADVLEARDGVEAVALARGHSLDLVVMDVKMPKLDGIEAAREIIAIRPVAIVMLTAYSDEHSVARAADAGVFAYVVKPFREQDLLPAIETARARQREFMALTDAMRGQRSVEEAKGLLMRREGLSAGQAFVRLLEASKQSGQPIEVIASAVVSAYDAVGRTGKARSFP